MVVSVGVGATGGVAGLGGAGGADVAPNRPANVLVALDAELETEGAPKEKLLAGLVVMLELLEGVDPKPPNPLNPANFGAAEGWRGCQCMLCTRPARHAPRQLSLQGCSTASVWVNRVFWHVHKSNGVGAAEGIVTFVPRV